MVSYEAIYPGIEYSTLMPSYYAPPISKYQEVISEIGMALDARTANQLGDLNIKINPGEKTVEIQGIQGRTMESIPEQHLDEIRRLTKLAGVKPTLHGPMINASGLGEQGYTEENRISAENQIRSAVLRAHKLDPEGNIPVTFHSTAGLPEFKPHTMEEGKRKEQGVWIVNEDTGQFQFLRPEKRYFPEDKEFTGKAIKFEFQNEINRINDEAWTDRLADVNRYADFGESSLREVKNRFPGIYGELGKIDISTIKDETLKKNYEDAQRAVIHSQNYLRGSYRALKQLFNMAYNNVQNDYDKEKLEKFARKFAPEISRGIETDPERLEKLREIVDEGLKALSTIGDAPKMFKPLNDFVITKSAETFANVAESAYKQYGDKSPIISVENPPGGEGLSTANDLKNLIESSRNKFAENLVKNKGISKSEAQEIAKRLIGATWDVGHINMMRKKGYSEKDIIEQTKIIAPFVKHVHLSDNFGLDHTELPMGMGNVPFKPMMDEIKKAGFKGKEIIEAGNWWEFFSTQGGGNPFKPSIEAFNSPIYSMEYGPTWSQSGKYGAYYSGYGPINPQVHHNLYGTGFQNLPVELGGEIPGDKGRFAGTPNQ